LPNYPHRRAAEEHADYLRAVAERDRYPVLASQIARKEPMEDKVNLAEKLAEVDEAFDPRIVGQLNDYKLVVVKAKGEFVWHSHAETDDFFLVLAGQLTIQLRDRDVKLGPGEMFVVPRGVEHCPRSDEGAEILLIEPAGTVNTGDAPAGPMTRAEPT
jgi:mannose-6-phosphate isomerase-like protein (cupin superfamily)